MLTRATSVTQSLIWLTVEGYSHHVGKSRQPEIKWLATLHNQNLSGWPLCTIGKRQQVPSDCGQVFLPQSSQDSHPQARPEAVVTKLIPHTCV